MQTASFSNSHILPAVEVTIFCCVDHCLINAFLVDGAQTCCRNFQNYPFIPLWNVESLDLQVRTESSLGLSVWVWNVVSTDDLLTCNLTNSWHFSNIFLFLFAFTKRTAKIQLFLIWFTFFLKKIKFFFLSQITQMSQINYTAIICSLKREIFTDLRKKRKKSV